MIPWHVAKWALALAAGLALFGSQGALAANAPSPTLTVVGYGVVNLPPQKSGLPQLQFYLNVHGQTAVATLRTLNGDVAAIEHRLKALGLRTSAFQPQGPPQLNYVTGVALKNCQKVAKLKPGLSCQKPGYTANEGLQVTFPSLQSIASALSRTDVSTAHGVQNFYINPGGTEPQAPTTVALTAGYRAALKSARQTAVALAAAEGVTLGPVLTVTEGGLTASSGCGAMGCGPEPVTGVVLPQVGPDQELVGVTLTYATRP